MPSVEANVNSKLFRKIGFWLFIAAVIVSTGIAVFSDFGRVAELLGRISPGWLMWILGAVIFNYVLRFLKWAYFLHLLHLSVQFKDSIWTFFSAFTMVLSPGKIGEVVKSLLLKARYGYPVSKTAPIVLAERITDLLGLLILSLYGASRFAFGGGTLAIFCFIIVGGIFLITRKLFWSYLRENVAARFAQLDKFRSSLIVLEESTSNLLALKPIAVTTMMSAISWAGEGMALFFIFQALGVSREELLGISIFAHAFSSIVGAFSFLPGGLLVTEGTLGVFFVFVGIGTDQSVSATFLIRALTLWFAVFLGATVFLLGKRPWEKFDGI